jgi:zeta-carotene isomerase
MRLRSLLSIAVVTTTTRRSTAFVVTKTSVVPSRQPVVASFPAIDSITYNSASGLHSTLAILPLRSSSTSRDNNDEETPTPPPPSPASFALNDAAYFSLQEQSLVDWVKFAAAVAAVMTFDAWLWVLPQGPHGGDAFLQLVQRITAGITGTSSSSSSQPDVVVFTMLLIFAIFHSGLAGLRTYAEPYVGARAWRVVFAVVSLPLALSCISYFINHAHDGVQLWDLTHVPGLHAALWVTNFISFLFLYPSTFNLLEVAAIQKPQLRLWDTGIMRITRHPQAMGQILWCAAHTAWLGSSTALAASTVLVLHHLFSIPHGDRRLLNRHGEAFEYLKSKTSIIPFQAILEGRQELPNDYYKEFLRLPYFAVVGGTVAAYFAHPYMQAGAAYLHW